MAMASGVRFLTVCFAGGATKLMSSSAVTPGQSSSSGGALASGSGRRALRRTLSERRTKWRGAHTSQESVANPQGTTLYRSERACEQKRGGAANVGGSTSCVLGKPVWHGRPFVCGAPVLLFASRPPGGPEIRFGAIPATRTSGHHTTDSKQ